MWWFFCRQYPEMRKVHFSFWLCDCDVSDSSETPVGVFERRVSSLLPHSFWNRACANLVSFLPHRKPVLLSASAFAFPSSSWLKLAKPVTLDLGWSWDNAGDFFLLLGKKSQPVSSRRNHEAAWRCRKQSYMVYTLECVCKHAFRKKNCLVPVESG